MAGTFPHIWFPHFSGKQVQFWCDNESVVAIINSGHSKAPRIMDLLRFLVLVSMKHNFFVRVRHVPGVSNEIADALSHFQRHVSGQRLPMPCKPLAPSRLRSRPSKGWSSNVCTLGPSLDYKSYDWLRGETLHSILPYE